MGTIVTRIKEYLDFKGISNAAFEKSMGLSNAAFRNLLIKGGAIGSDKLENFISLHPEVSLRWLITGEGDMLNSDQPENPAEAPGTERASLSSAEMLLRDMLTEKEGKIDALNQVIWELKEENGKLKALLGERKRGTAADADFSSAADAV